MAKFCSNCALPLAGLDGVLFCPGCHQGLGRQPANALTLRGRVPTLEPRFPRQPVQFDGGGTWRRYHAMESSIPLALPAPSDAGGSVTASRRSPARTPEFEGDVAVPAGQAVLIGLAVSILSFPLPWIIPGNIGGLLIHLPWWTFALVAPVAWALAVVGLVASGRRHLWNIEEVTQETAPIEVAPAPAPDGEIKLIISRHDENGKFIRGLNLTLPAGVTQAEFYEFARGATRRGASLAVGDWTGAGKPFSKSVYGALLLVLDEAGIIEWRDESNPSVGRRLTDEGRAALVEYVKEG